MIAGGGYGFGRSLGAHGYGYGIGVGVPETHSGGWEHRGYYEHGHRRTKKERKEARKYFGVVFDVIEKVAENQAKHLHLDDQQRFDELFRELKLHDIEYKPQYMEYLNVERGRLINDEIANLLKKKQLDKRDEEELVLMMFIAMSL
jgi:hypothetical protein